MAPRRPPRLMDDLIGEILLRLPPEDPECLVRASLVCKHWHRLLADPCFPRRYREFHGSPPLLGFFHNTYHMAGWYSPSFIPVKGAFRAIKPQPEPHCWTIDCRHGRVLLGNYKTDLIVWDPITNIHQHIGRPMIKDSVHSSTAAVLCTVVGCDHLSCHGGPSLVVYVDVEKPNQQDASASASARVYSTEIGAWNATVSSVQLGPNMYGCDKMIGSSLFAADALYFILQEGWRILKYDMVGCRLSVMSPPPLPVGNMVLMKAEGGGLGAFGVEGHSLNLWAWRSGPGGNWEWKKDRVIQLDIGDLCTKLDVVDFAEGAGSIFVRTENGFFAVELKSARARKIGGGYYFKEIFPFLSFYMPGTSLMPTDLSTHAH